MTTTPVMTITDEQIAEIEAEAKWCSRASISSEVESDELLALISRLRSAEKDAERYRFVRDKCTADLWERLSYESGELFDLLTDAAMEQSK